MVSDTTPPAQPTHSIDLSRSSGREPDVIAEMSVALGILEQQQHEDVDARTRSLDETLHEDL
jgi:hypothetical protein